MEESPLENIREARGFEDRVEASSALTTTRLSVNARDCRTRMAHVTLAAPITGLSGKLSKSHACVFNMRQAPTNNDRMISMPCYTNWRENKHTKRASTTWNTQFAQIAADTRARLKNPTYVDDDVVAFKAQSKFKTLYAFVFNIVKEGVLSGK